MDIYKEAILMHSELKGKIDIISKVRTETEHDLALAYSPGVAEPCRRIAADPELLNEYTARGNMVAVVSDGSSVLGLGNIGARASLPVMEGKCVLFKQFGGVSAFPLCIDSQDNDRIVETVKLLEPSFSGISLEDIAAPRCFQIEERLKTDTDMLIFHDDQHGTAIVVLAGLFNALRYYDLDIKEVKISYPVYKFSTGKRDVILKVRFTLRDSKGVIKDGENYYVCEHHPLGNTWYIKHSAGKYRYFMNFFL